MFRHTTFCKPTVDSHCATYYVLQMMDLLCWWWFVDTTFCKPVRPLAFHTTVRHTTFYKSMLPTCSTHYALHTGTTAGVSPTCATHYVLQTGTTVGIPHNCATHYILQIDATYMFDTTFCTPVRTSVFHPPVRHTTFYGSIRPTMCTTNVQVYLKHWRFQPNYNDAVRRAILPSRKVCGAHKTLTIQPCDTLRSTTDDVPPTSVTRYVLQPTPYANHCDTLRSTTDNVAPTIVTRYVLQPTTYRQPV
ncbi:hypothetical protein J6590_040765 [Homalodisca vitripennis]|nr:hypothetical protein J6590_040765 [Homalodisca vitripennis]